MAACRATLRIAAICDMVGASQVTVTYPDARGACPRSGAGAELLHCGMPRIIDRHPDPRQRSADPKPDRRQRVTREPHHRPSGRSSASRYRFTRGQSPGRTQICRRTKPAFRRRSRSARLRAAELAADRLIGRGPRGDPVPSHREVAASGQLRPVMREGGFLRYPIFGRARSPHTRG